VKHLTHAAALLLALAATETASAQSRRAAARPAAASAPAAAPANAVPGPPIAGVCAYNNERAVRNSLVGRAADARLGQLQAQAGAELSAQQTSLQNDAKALEAKRASLTQAQLQQQAAPLQARAQQLNQTAQVRQREMELTTQKALQQIYTQIQPIVQSISAQRNCSILLSGESVLSVNPAMDLTPAVVEQLNTRMSTISFDREHLPAQAAAGR